MIVAFLSSRFFRYTLSPQDPLFHRIGNSFVRQVSRIFGSDSFYNADPFNEMDPSSNDTAYLSSVASAIYRSMADADPNAVWVLQVAAIPCFLLVFIFFPRDGSCWTGGGSRRRPRPSWTGRPTIG